MIRRIRMVLLGCGAAVVFLPGASPASSQGSVVEIATGLESVAVATLEWSVASDSLLGAGLRLDSENDSKGVAETVQPTPPPPGVDRDSLTRPSMERLDSLATLVPGADPAQMQAWLDRIVAVGARLPANDRLVFDELVAAAREMLDMGDPEATRLLAADAIAVLREEAR